MLMSTPNQPSIKYQAFIYFSEIECLYAKEEYINTYNNKSNELIWILEHNEIYTAGTSSKNEEILNKDIKVINTNRGGKITYHGPGQLVCYFVIDLREKKDIRKFITTIENTIIQSLKKYNIETFADKENIGIWHEDKNKIQKIAAIGIRVRKWIAYHGFAINIDNNLENYKKIVPCGISDKGVTNLKKISNQDYSNLYNEIIENFISNLKI